MAKNNNNYITRMIATYGDTWVSLVKPEDIQRSGKRIVREMVRGDINYQVLGSYFLDLKFLDNVIIACQNALDETTLLYTALSFYHQYNPEIVNIGLHETHLAVLCNIYNTVLSRLQLVRTTGNIGWLADISAMLYNYRNHLS